MPDDAIHHSVFIEAPAEVVYSYFTDAERMLRWQGQWAALDARPGGTFAVDINGLPIRGEFLELDPPRRLVLSWGHAGSQVLPPGASRVEVELTPSGSGTVVTVRHSGLVGDEAANHRMGWRHFLDRFAIAATGRDPGPDPWAAMSAQEIRADAQRRSNATD